MSTWPFAFAKPRPAAALTLAHEAGEGDEDATPSEGHYHVYLDTTQENPILQEYRPMVSMTVTASAGAHRLIVRLNDNLHRFLNPEVKSEIDITLE